MTVPQRSLYWFHLCAGVPAKTQTNVRLNGLDYPAVAYSSVNDYPADQLTVDTLQWVRRNTTLTVSTEEPLFSSLNMETAWLGFRLDNLFTPLIAFAAQLTSTKEFHTILIFDRVLVNEGNCYNEQNGVFIVPISGNYFFSVIVSAEAKLMVNRRGQFCVCACDNMRKPQDIVSTRASVMLALNARDSVYILSNRGVSNKDGLRFASYKNTIMLINYCLNGHS